MASGHPTIERIGTNGRSHLDVRIMDVNKKIWINDDNIILYISLNSNLTHAFENYYEFLLLLTTQSIKIHFPTGKYAEVENRRIFIATKYDERIHKKIHPYNYINVKSIYIRPSQNLKLSACFIKCK